MTFYKNLLLVDDDADDHEIFVEAVKEIDASIRCTCLFDGEEALKMLDENKKDLPDLIILDTNMPKVTGKQLLAEIKKSPSLNNIPVIMYSTFFSDRDIEDLKQLGAVHHLPKPSKFEDFRNSLNDILKKKW
jgi:CheY-like chemotaxis protein